MSEELAVAFRTLGCKVNRAESEDIAADLLGRGVRVTDADHAAVVVINTCTVTAEADAKARKAVRQALKAAGGPIVVVTGCLAALDADALRALGSRVVVEADKNVVADRVAEALELADRSAAASPVRVGEGFRTRVMVKIEDGCDAFCTYCIVPHARGLPRAVPLDTVVGEVERLVAAGVKEVVLTGINLGRYRDGVAGLAAVVEAVAATGVRRLRLSSIEPMDLDDHLLGVLAATPAFCAHLHVPLQSGSDAVLSAMGRAYTLAEYAERVSAARAALPGLALTTDVIAGFPGETDRDAARTEQACEELAFAKLHVFRYSARTGTSAAGMPQVDPSLRQRRAEGLRNLDHRLRERFLTAHAGSTAEVLVERVADGYAEGTTRDYIRVGLACQSACAPGDLVGVVLGAGGAEPLCGSLARGQA